VSGQILTPFDKPMLAVHAFFNQQGNGIEKIE
jgi:hypothetical protein